MAAKKEADQAAENGVAAGGEEEAPQTIMVSCEGGIYVDAKSGEVVYLQNVEVAEPRFRMPRKNGLASPVSPPIGRLRDHTRIGSSPSY